MTGLVFGEAPPKPPPEPKRPPSRRASAAAAAAAANASLAPDPGKPAAPFLRFRVLEVDANDMATQAATHPAPPTTKSTQPWFERPLALKLPEGSPRPPLVRIELWDGGTPGAAGGSGARVKPLAKAEIRLTGRHGTHEARLDYPYEDARRVKRVKQVGLSFAYHLEEDEAALMQRAKDRNYIVSIPDIE